MIIFVLIITIIMTIIIIINIVSIVVFIYLCQEGMYNSLTFFITVMSFRKICLNHMPSLIPFQIFYVGVEVVL